MTHTAVAVRVVREDGDHLTLFAFCSCAPEAVGVFRGTKRTQDACPDPANPAHERGGLSAMCWRLTENADGTLTGAPSLDLSGGPPDFAHFHTGNPFTLPVRA